MKIISLYRLKTISKQKKFVIPCIFTLLNACCGFLSLIKTLEGDFIGAAYCIIGAVCMDALDGRVARLLRSTSAIGMELDSLADAVSFCVAPALLVYSMYGTNSSFKEVLLVSFYMCAGLSRLARFNVSVPKQFFIGLPTPVAAFCVAQFVLHEAWIVHRSVISPVAFVFCAIIILGLLMISPLPYPSFKKWTGITMGIGGSGMVIVAFLSWWYALPFFLITVLAYILGGSFLCW